MISRIAIIGTGLIGASFGLAVRRGRPDLEVIGYDNSEALLIAKKRGAITSMAPDVKSAVQDADVVLIAAPLLATQSLLADMAPALKPDAIISDVCSVKRPVHETARNFLPRGVRFVGGHPMAGSEKRGPTHADEFMFENATYVLCPDNEDTKMCFESEYAEFLALIRLTGARVMVLTAESHDRIAAAISHLPQLLAVGLVHFAGNASHTDSQLLLLAAGGFRDMTRIASSPYAMWEQIISANSDEIYKALDGYISILGELRSCLAAPAGPRAAAITTLKSSNEDDRPNISGIEHFFRSAEATRSTIPKKNKGFLRPLADMFVFVTDEPGAIHRMTGVLSDARINIRDIELLKIREGTGGTFRIGLDTDQDAERGLRVLAEAGFRAHRLT